MLIPVGQRNTRRTPTGSLVDVVDQGRRLGVEVREVQRRLRGVPGLHRRGACRSCPSSGDAQLDEKAYDRLKAQADAALARSTSRPRVFASLDPAVQDRWLGPACQTRPRPRPTGPRNLRDPGPAGRRLQSAPPRPPCWPTPPSATAEACRCCSPRAPTPSSRQGRRRQAIEGEVYALLDTLKTDEPATVSDAVVADVGLRHRLRRPVGVAVRLRTSSSAIAATRSAAAPDHRRRHPAAARARSSTTSCPAASSTWPRTSTTSAVTSAARHQSTTSTWPRPPTSSARAPTPTSPPSRATW